MLSNARILLRIAVFTIVTFYVQPTLCLWAFSYKEYWEERDRACFGNVRQMLKELDAAPKLWSVRTNWTHEGLFDALKKIGRLEQLGLSDAEGSTLIEGFFKKMGIKPSAPLASPSIVSPTPDVQELFSYRAGTEFEALDAILLRWPAGYLPWMNKWAEMVSALSEADVKLYMWVNGLVQFLEGRLYLNVKQVPAEHLQWVLEPTDSVWIRDYGPQFVYDLSSDAWGIVDFHYYDFRARDDDTPQFIANRLEVPLIDRQTNQVVYTEGGNLNHDGLGCVVYSKRTYSNNRGVARSVIDERILSAFQAHKAIVPQPPIFDGTGHVDMFMKIVSPDTVLVGQYQPGQLGYHVLEDCAALFESTTNGADEPWNVVRIPQPVVYFEDFIWPVVRTYTNSLIVNNVVILPVYNLPEDDEAIAIYESVLPEKTIYPLDARDIIASGGAWHCVTMEFPSPTNPD